MNFFKYIKKKLKKEESKIIAKNTILLSISRVFTSLIPVITFVYLGRGLGNDGVGLLFGIISLVLLFYPFSDFGFSQIIIRDISRYPENSKEILIKGQFITLLSTIPFIIFVLISSLAIRKFPISIVFIVGLSYIFFHGIIRFWVSAFQGIDRLEMWAWIEILDNLLKFLFTILIYHLNKLNVFNASLTYLISSIICFIVITSYGYKSFGFVPLKIVNITRKEFFESNHFSINFMGDSLFFQIDKVMLSKYSTFADVGIYTFAQKVYSLFVNVIGAFQMTTYSWFFRYGKGDRAKFLSFSKKAIYIVSFLSLMAGLFVYIFASYIAKVMGGSFENSIYVLRFFFLYPFLRGISMSLGDIMSGIDAQKQRMQIKFIGVFVNILLNFLLIFKFGWRGVALASLVSYGLVSLLEYFYIHNKLVKNGSKSV